MQILLAGAAVVGVGLALQAQLPLWIAGLSAFGAGGLALLGRPRAVLLGLALLALALGLVRGQTHLATRPTLAATSGGGVELSATGTVIRAPGRLDRSPLLIELDAVHPVFDEANNPLPTPAAPGDRLHIFTYSPAYIEGARLGIEGSLRLYRNYESRRTIGRVDGAWISSRPADRPTVAGGMASVRRRLDRAIHDALPEPHAGLLSAILLGVRADIPAAVMQDLRDSGLIHLIAISGYNVTLLAIVIRRTAGLALGRRGIWIAIALLPLYAILVGGDPPVVRATIMAELVLLAWLLGRESDLLVSLAVTGAAMVLLDPDILFNPGFQLSFVATAGLALLAPRIADRLSALPRVLAELIAITVSAQLLVTPLLVLHFGGISLVAIPANVLAVGFSPWVMLTGIVAMLWSVFGLPALEAITWSVWAPIEYLLRIAALAGDTGLARVPVPPAPGWSVAAVYLLTAGLLWRLGRPAEPTTEAGATAPARFAVVSLVVLAFVAPPLIGGVAELMRVRPELQIHALLTGKRPSIYGRTAAGTNFMIVGSGHSEPLLDRALPFYDGDLDLVILPDADRRATDVVAAVAAGRKIDRLWTPQLDLGPEAFVAGRDRHLIPIDFGTTVEILPPVGTSAEFTIRLVAGDFTVLLPPSTAPLSPPTAWRADLLLFGDRPPSAFITPEFLDATGANALIAALGPDGAAVIVPAAMFPHTPVATSPIPASNGPAVRLEQTGNQYLASFVRS